MCNAPLRDDVEWASEPEKLLQPGSSTPACNTRARCDRRLCRGLTAAVTAAVLMAGYLVLGKLFLGSGSGAGPTAFLVCRQVLASGLLVAGALALHGPQLPRRADMLSVQRLGLYNFINALGFLWGGQLTTPFVTSVAQLAIPVLVLAHAACCGRQRVTFFKVIARPLSSLPHTALAASLFRPTQAAGVLVLVAGCALVAAGAHSAAAAPSAVGRPRGHHGSARLLLGLAVLAVQCSSFVGLLLEQVRTRTARQPDSRDEHRRRRRRDRRDRRHDLLTLAAPLSQERLVRSYPVSWVLAWAYASCTLLSCAAAAADGSLGAVGAALASPRDAAIVVYSAMCGCVAYFVLIAYASKQLPAELVSVTVAVEPLAVSALSMLLLGAEPCAAEGVGFALAFGGTGLLSRAVQSESEGGERGGQAGPPGGASDQEASFRDPLIRA